MSILRRNRNVWRIERARRAAMLIDGAAYFGALREAMLQARRSICIVGWDIDSRMKLVGPSGRAADGLPETLAEFLSALVERRPELTVYVLLWDFSVLYALEREIFPQLNLNWKTPDQIRFCLDNQAPLGCSQHQKIVTVDASLAFSGGLDLTIRRWDTSDHAPDNRLRCDPSGVSYRPFHDVQAMVDGDAAAALASLVRERWLRADCRRAPAAESSRDCWPASVAADFTDISVGIARTEPECGGAREVREVETLFFDMIDAAERSIYIENQFLTSIAVAERLARRMRKKRRLETVIVVPNTPESWIEKHTMHEGRLRFQDVLKEAGVFERVRLVHPEVAQNGDVVSTMVHSKIMAIDDRLLRIGSANLNNRSMGADTECDVVVEAQTPAQRQSVCRLRNRLIADHCGAQESDVAELLEDTGALTAVVDILARNGHRLSPVEDGEAASEPLAASLQGIADPPRPLTARTVFRSAIATLRIVSAGQAAKFLLAAVLVGALTLAWRLTPLADYADVDYLRSAARAAAGSYWGPVAVVGAFVLGGLVAFPVTIMIAATAAGFGPWLGFVYALIGALLSAVTTYGIGAAVGRDALTSFLGKRLTDIRRKIVDRGVIAVAAIRLVPVAPFTLVNLVAGASGIRLGHYIAGTVIGLLPGMVVLSLLGNQVVRILSSPTPLELAIAAVLLVAWLGMALGLQSALSRIGNPPH